MSALTPATNEQLRPELGDFSSIVCFKAMVVGIEEALGEKAAAIALIAAGRVRGRQVATQLSLDTSNVSLAEVASILNTTLGKDGTRLCIIDKIIEEDDFINVFCQETVCSSGEPQGSSRCLSFTLGAIQGALEQITKKRLRGKQIESVLRGSTHDVLQFQSLN
jgi:predicted hydrocarbon binding protein